MVNKHKRGDGTFQPLRHAQSHGQDRGNSHTLPLFTFTLPPSFFFCLFSQKKLPFSVFGERRHQVTSQGLLCWETLPASSLPFQFTGISQTLERRDFTFFGKKAPDLCLWPQDGQGVTGVHILQAVQVRPSRCPSLREPHTPQCSRQG